ncbi:MAG: ECF transporter S component [Bacilli bacterium]|nr:ECF transporter S component [Bacilli bacterium]
MKITVKDIAIDAIFVGIIAVMTFVPMVGMIAINSVVSFTLLHLPVVLGAYLFGWRKGLVLGVAMGVCSMLKAIIAPTGALDPLFVWPWISVLPRALFGYLSGLFFDLLHKNSKLYGNPLIVGLLSFAFTVMHTVFVFGSLFIFFPNETYGLLSSESPFAGGITVFVAIIILFGMLGEATLAGIVTPALGKGTMFVAKRFRSDDREEEKE